MVTTKKKTFILKFIYVSPEKEHLKTDSVCVCVWGHKFGTFFDKPIMTLPNVCLCKLEKLLTVADVSEMFYL